MQARTRQLKTSMWRIIWMLAGPSQSIAGLARATGLSQDQVHTTLRRLERTGLACRVTPSTTNRLQWSLTEAGKAAVIEFARAARAASRRIEHDHDN